MVFDLYETLKPKLIRPVPAPLRGVACARCDKNQSSWWADLEHEGEDKAYVCSLCMMYNTAWGRTARASVEEVVREIEKSRDREFDKDPSNQLLKVRDADDVMGVVVLADRVTGVRRTAESWKA